ncbi:uncharacterized protein EAF02_003632 [Botrytis sinoallii]|uniref:uncharacterized protein n=1 Tax=Botrytis sinoallii TaxID=1463999 RepID=UPI001901F302|nr:uncharacterized protein EAF02_003632 [Botrytis sinoallii]KAF7886985.1 hypothetical protein EAF02_003632 [Botrytis sinoallii]
MTVYYLHGPIRSSLFPQRKINPIPSPLHYTYPPQVSAATNETAGQIVSSDSTGPTQTKKDKTGDTRIPGKRRKNGRACFKVGRRGSRAQLIS